MCAKATLFSSTDNYLKGAVAVTEIACQTTEEEVSLTIAPRSGSYEGMPESRTFDIWIHNDAQEQVTASEDPDSGGHLAIRSSY